MIDMNDLVRDLRELGVNAGDVLFVHSSFRSIGPVEGGAGTVTAALEQAVGADGLILMPAFNLVAKEQRAATWDHATTRSTVGWLTEFFRTMPGTVRSNHYSHSVAARGRVAEAFVSDARIDEGMKSPWDLEPWGKTYGEHSAFMKAYRAGGRVLLLGVDYHCVTYMHLVEVMRWNRLLAENPGSKYRFSRRDKLGEAWERTGRVSRGSVGRADSRLFSIRDFVDSLLTIVDNNPNDYLVD